MSGLHPARGQSWPVPDFHRRYCRGCHRI